jgi:hypothetical protein
MQISVIWTDVFMTQQRTHDLTGLPASLRSLSSSKVALPKAFQPIRFANRLPFLTLPNLRMQASDVVSH